MAAWPLVPAATRAQDAAMPVIGFLSTAEPRGYAHLVAGFRAGLAEAGFVEGRNIAIEFRFAEGKFDRLPPSRRRPRGAKGCCDRTVFGCGDARNDCRNGNDPVAQGFVTSLNRPGGNTTGVSFFATNLGGKRLGLLRELLPNARQTGVYAGRVLKGEKPADLPVLQASKFELVINLTTARTLGLTVPSVMMAIADEVVE
jgi:putative ABC transport system substrate-binding protein